MNRYAVKNGEGTFEPISFSKMDSANFDVWTCFKFYEISVELMRLSYVDGKIDSVHWTHATDDYTGGPEAFSKKIVDNEFTHCLIKHNNFQKWEVVFYNIDVYDMNVWRIGKNGFEFAGQIIDRKSENRK